MQTKKCVSKVDKCGTIETNDDDNWNKNYFWCFFLSSFTSHAIKTFFLKFSFRFGTLLWNDKTNCEKIDLKKKETRYNKKQQQQQR